MSLFIGNISRNADYRDIEKAFQSFGRCKFNPRGKYGFIEFDKEIDAEDAKDSLQGKNFGGLRINIEWSKKSGHFDPREHDRRRRRYHSRSRSHHRRSRSPYYRRRRRRSYSSNSSSRSHHRRHSSSRSNNLFFLVTGIKAGLRERTGEGEEREAIRGIQGGLRRKARGRRVGNKMRMRKGKVRIKNYLRVNLNLRVNLRVNLNRSLNHKVLRKRRNERGKIK